MLANPFKPTAGKMPPVLIGRQSIIDDFTEGLSNGAGAPGRLMLITGQRGYGKTVMLTQLRRVAQAQGWLVVADTASAGLCDRLVESLSSERARLAGVEINPSLDMPGGLSAGLGSFTLSTHETGSLTLRRAIEKRLDSRKIGKGKGVLFTIDEAQVMSREELVSIATAVQHVIADEDEKDAPDAEKKGIAFVFAGLPSMVDELINDRVLTFLRRSLHRELAEVPIPDVRDALIVSAEQSGKHIDFAVAAEAARRTDGYPYMIQLVGYYMWQSSQRRGSDVIEQQDVALGYDDALTAFGDAVCAPALAGIPSAARRFAHAMAQDVSEPTRVADIAERLGTSRSWVNKYRALLINERVIRAAGYGKVEFAIPHMGEYLRR